MGFGGKPEEGLWWGQNSGDSDPGEGVLPNDGSAAPALEDLSATYISRPNHLQVNWYFLNIF